MNSIVRATCCLNWSFFTVPFLWLNFTHIESDEERKFNLNNHLLIRNWWVLCPPSVCEEKQQLFNCRTLEYHFNIYYTCIFKMPIRIRRVWQYYQMSMFVETFRFDCIIRPLYWFNPNVINIVQYILCSCTVKTLLISSFLLSHSGFYAMLF